MIPEDISELLKRQHYVIAGKHSAVQVCRWTKKALTGEGVCYKQKFYGIKSYGCCQMTPAVMWCPNKCLHCWRAIELTLGDKMENTDSAKEIVDKCIEAQKKLLTGFKSHKKIDMVKWEDAQEPSQFAISLSGEPLIYDKICDLVEELRARNKTSFIVTNGLYPEKIQEMIDKNCLPTQLYISVNSPNKELYDRFHRSSMKDAWEKLNKSLEIMGKIKGRTVFRINLVKDLNMNASLEKKRKQEKEPKDYPELYSEMIKKANPMFIEVKGFMSVGYARERLGYDKMPYHEDIVDFAKKILKFLPEYKILDEHEFSRVVLLGKSEEGRKI